MTTHPHATLSARLRSATRDLHQHAEHSGVMVELLHARIGHAAYVGLLRQLHAVYAALEAGLDRHAGDADVRRLWQPALRRLPALERDLDALQPGDWRSDTALLPPAADYAAHLHALAQQAPQLLLAHAYVRYLGDLHGGQMLAQRVRRALALGGEAGTAFYDFGEPAPVEALRHDFRAGLDALALSGAQAGAFVAEACAAFTRHQQLFDALQARFPPGG